MSEAVNHAGDDETEDMVEDAKVAARFRLHTFDFPNSVEPGIPKSTPTFLSASTFDFLNCPAVRVVESGIPNKSSYFDGRCTHASNERFRFDHVVWP